MPDEAAVLDAIDTWGLNFNVGTAVKLILLAGSGCPHVPSLDEVKRRKIDALKQACTQLEREIARLRTT